IISMGSSDPDEPKIGLKTLNLGLRLEQEWEITSPNEDNQLPQDEVETTTERELEITSSNEDNQLPQDEADLMAT
ncbi:hypothetical protein IWQ61_010599, partial [Dispira simplex]